MYIEKIAYALGRNDEEPNIDLAIDIVKNNAKNGILEMVNGLNSKQEQIANDCIKVLYEIGERKPELISDYVHNFIELLRSRNNRLVWGGMTALGAIANLKPEEIFNSIEMIIHAHNKGSVITVDNSITVITKLIRINEIYAKTLIPVLIKHFSECPSRAIPQHIERAFICIDESNCEQFIAVLQKRYDELSASQKRRVDRIIKKVGKKEFTPTITST